MSWLLEPDDEWDTPAADRDRPKSRLKILALVLAGWVVVSSLVLVGLLAFSGHRGVQHPLGLADQGRSTPAPSPMSTPSVAVSRPSGWAQRGSDDQTNCAAHAYGAVQLFFRRIPCSSVHRELDTTTRSGRAVVIASSMVTFATTADAAAYRALVTTDGTGNVSDLLREGVRYPGGPAKLPTAAFNSRQSGTRVLVAEAAYAVGGSDPEDATLKAMAAQAVTSR